MSEENFEKELEAVSSELESQSVGVPGNEDISASMQDEIRQIESLAKMDPEFANSDEYKDLRSALDKEGIGNAESEEAESEEAESEEQEEEEEGEENKDDVFGISKNKKKQKELKIDFDVPDAMVDLISSKFGIEDPAKFFSSVDTWRSQAQEGMESLKEYENLSSDLQAMPHEIKQAIQLWANGDDYSEAFNKNERLDFSDGFKSQDSENLVQHYLEDQYNDLVDKYNNDDMSDDDFEDRIELLAGTTKRMFNQDVEALEEKRENFVQGQKDEYQRQKDSANLSVDNLGKAYPNFSNSEINKIKRVLVDGNIDDIFVESDGSYKEDAAEFLAYAMYGRKIMSNMQKTAKRQGESEANMKIVDSSPKKIRRQKSSDQKRGIDMDAVGHLSSAFKKDPYA